MNFNQWMTKENSHVSNLRYEDMRKSWNICKKEILKIIKKNQETEFNIDWVTLESIEKEIKNL